MHSQGSSQTEKQESGQTDTQTATDGQKVRQSNPEANKSQGDSQTATDGETVRHSNPKETDKQSNLFPGRTMAKETEQDAQTR